MEEVLLSAGAQWLSGSPPPEFWGTGPSLLSVGLSAYMSKDSIVSL